MSETTLHTVFFIRILMACACGLAIGLERQHRTKSVGARTHLMISVASALMMLVSKYGFLDLAGTQTGITTDISRVAASIITGIGIFGGGIIYMGKQGAVTGLTTTAGVWVTVGIGMSCGAGMYFLAITTTLVVLICQYILHSKFWLIRQSIRVQLIIRLDDNMESYQKICDFLSSQNIEMHETQWDRKNGNMIDLKCQAVIPDKFSRDETIKMFAGIPEVISFEILHN